MIAELKRLIEKLTDLASDRFQGNVTISFANGTPKKIKIESFTDL